MTEKWTEKYYYSCFFCNKSIIKFIDNDNIRYIDEHTDVCPLSKVSEKTPEFYEKLIDKCEKKSNKKAEIEYKIKQEMQRYYVDHLTYLDCLNLTKLKISLQDWSEIVIALEKFYNIKIDNKFFGISDRGITTTLGEMVDYIYVEVIDDIQTTMVQIQDGRRHLANRNKLAKDRESLTTGLRAISEKEYYTCYYCGGDIIKFINEDDIEYEDEHTEDCPISTIPEKTLEFYERLIAKGEIISDRKAEIENKLKRYIMNYYNPDLKFSDPIDLTKLNFSYLDWIVTIIALEESLGLKIDEKEIGISKTKINITFAKMVNYIAKKKGYIIK
ncbi:MAG: hypothetical protein HQ521_01170 [Bacteroidetes bacterium]|nr:hypothetical protein [Bacteroidota bacterium]